MATLVEQCSARPKAEYTTILCCLCGKSIQPNGANMCRECLHTNVDVTEGISKTGVLLQCKKCFRWLHNNQWVRCELESPELLAVCLKRIHGLNKNDLVDASFIWTEPHSKRVKVRATVRREVLNGVNMQQQVVVELVVRWQQCPDCGREFVNQTWRAKVQVRQRVDHKRTFLYLEQLMLRRNAAKMCVDMDPQRDGVDFFFSQKAHAVAFTEFLLTAVPCRVKVTKKMVSMDSHSNVHNNQHSMAVDLVPLCREDLVVLPRGSGNSLSGAAALVVRVTSVLHLVDPTTLARAELPADKFWRAPVAPLLTVKALAEFVVLDVEPVDPAAASAAAAAAASPAAAGGGGGGGGREDMLADITVARAADFGVTDESIVVRSHLGHLLEAGDSVLGYDLARTNFNDADLGSLRGELPDVILVRKYTPKAKGKEGGAKEKGGKGKKERRQRGGGRSKEAAAKAAAAKSGRGGGGGDGGGDPDGAGKEAGGGSGKVQRAAARHEQGGGAGRSGSKAAISAAGTSTAAEASDSESAEAEAAAPPAVAVVAVAGARVGWGLGGGAEDFEEFLMELRADPELREALGLDEDGRPVAGTAAADGAEGEKEDESGADGGDGDASWSDGGVVEGSGEGRDIDAAESGTYD